MKIKRERERENYSRNDDYFASLRKQSSERIIENGLLSDREARLKIYLLGDRALGGLPIGIPPYDIARAAISACVAWPRVCW